MKKILLSVALLTVGSLSAQSYFSEDFSGGLTSWNLVDSDNDGFQWTSADYGDGQGNVATSASWDSNAGVLTPDNWMISPAINLSAASGTVYLSWLAYAQDQSWANENYSVYVSLNNDVPTLTGEGADFNEVIGTSSGYVSRSIDVSAFAGQTIYVAFRHHNVSDQFRLNIDDVNVAQVNANDLELTSVEVDNMLEGNRTFTITVTNKGLSTITGYNLDWSFDGGTVTTENVTGISLNFGDTHTILASVNGVVAGNASFNAQITTSDDDATNNSLNEAFTFVVPVPQYVATDSHGNPFDLHAALSGGQAIVLDFMASWCGPCQSSTPEISEFIQNNGSGNGRVEALAITVEPNDNNAVLNGLNWNGGFYEYPKFAYTAANNNQYYHYAVNHGFNSGGGIPFFVMICPNLTQPSHSTIVRDDVGYGSGMFAAYQTALNNCPTAIADLIEEVNDNITLNVYPNPATNNATVSFETESASNTVVTVTNGLGQTVYVQDLGKVSGVNEINLNTADFEAGIYTVTIKTEYSQSYRQLSVIK
ncbi:MAG: choice-of-anchor J domain-containing protein [Brumimicrobium sp.]|nr:choice-of-anchor J domain-containing protein [Brumimicrobium sp.]